MDFMEIPKDDEAFDNLLCLIIVGGVILAIVVNSFRGDKDLNI